MAVMARRTTTTPPPEDFEETIVDIDVTDEMRGSFLEYAYSVIYQRALPDARDGLKPVQRRILFQMSEMGLRPDRPHVKCARVVGDVMGRLHPHGDSAIYDTLVRMAQPWAMRLPLIDGHGNFGSLGGDDSAAAYRYTEARLAAAAMEMVASIDEDTVDFQPNYDGQDAEPQVLPAAIPNLLVNGAAGIAVGMATNMPPHNLGEVVAAARHLIADPGASLDELMRFVPGPDLPTGGKIVGLDGIRDAYETGRGLFRTRAATRIEQITPRRTGIVVTELPYGIGPEKVVTRIKDLVQAKKLAGIADLKDLTDRHRGLHLVIEIRSGFHAEAVLDELYRLTPMEDTFGINNVALVDGQPRVLGLRELLQIYVDHRIEVVRRRTAFRRRKREERLHLVDGLMIALLNIDEVIAVIRSSDDAAAAKERLMSVFDLSAIQAQYILDTPLRRLTRYDRLELEKERDTLQREIAELTAILDSEDKLREVVSAELASVAERFGTPRRTVLLEGSGAARTAAVPLEVADEPCLVLLSSAGLLARTAARPPAVQEVLPAERADSEREPPAAVAGPPGAVASRRAEGASPAGGLAPGARAAHDVIVSAVPSTARGTIGVLTSHGRLIRLGVLELPALPPSAHSPALAGGAPVSEFVSTERGETVIAIVAAEGEGARPRACHSKRRRQTGCSRLPAERRRLRGHHAQDWRPGGRRGAARRRGPGPGLHHQRRATAQVRRRGSTAAGQGRRRHDRDQAGAPRVRDLVRRGEPGRPAWRYHVVWAVAGQAGWPAVRYPCCGSWRPGRRHGGRQRGSAAWRVRSDREGDALCRVPAQGPGYRRRALSPVPEGRGCPGAGLGRARASTRRDRGGHAGAAAATRWPQGWLWYPGQAPARRARRCRPGLSSAQRVRRASPRLPAGFAIHSWASAGGRHPRS